MKATVTGIVAALEGAAIVLAGLALVAVPGVLLWWLALGMASDPAELAEGLAGTWLLAHLVPLRVRLTAESALSWGLAPEPLSFVLSLTPLALAGLTAVLAARAGWRFGRRGTVGAVGVAGAFAGAIAASSALATVAAPLLAWPTWWSATVPALWLGGWAAVGYVGRAIRDRHDWWRAALRALQRAVDRGLPSRSAVWASDAVRTLRLAAAGFAAVIALSGIGVAAAITIAYGQTIALSQGLQLDALANLLVFLLHLAFLPNLWVWALAWFSGSGFQIGIGTSVTPFDTLLGPVPAVPVFGAIPQGWGAAGVIAPLLVVLAALIAGAAIGRRPDVREVGWPATLATVVGAAAVVALFVVAVTALAGGAMGPGRLAVAGAAPWPTGALVFAEVALGLGLGVAAARADTAAAAQRLRPARAPGDARDAPGGATAMSQDVLATQPLDDAVTAPRRAGDAPSVHSDAAVTQPLDDHIDGTLVAAPPPPLASAVAPAPAVASPFVSPAPPESSESPQSSESPEPPNTTTDEEALLRAFAWDAAPDTGDPPARDARRKWRRRPPKG